MTVGINRTKASSHPSRVDGVYLGVVKRVLPDNKVYVYIPKFSNTIGPMRVTNLVSSDLIVEGDRVLCTYVGGSNEEMYVVAHLKIQSASSDGGPTGPTGPSGPAGATGATGPGVEAFEREIKLSIYMEV